MAAVDDLTELVERAASAEKSALSSKWKDESDVQGLIRTSARPPRSNGARSAWTPTRNGCRHDGPGCGSTTSTSGRNLRSPARSRGAPRRRGHPRPRRLSHQAAAQAEQDAVAAVGVARMALTDAALAVLQARLARIQAGEDQPDSAAVDGHVPLHGRNAVSRHGPALAHGVSGEIKYVLTRKPRNTVRSLGIALGLGLLYLGYLRVFKWDQNQQWLPYLGLWVISFVMGGAVCINAMSFDAMRVRAALDTGARLWHLLVIKNLALLCIVAPIGFLLSALLAWRAGDLGAFFKACALVICFILLWLGVGNVLSIWLPTRDEPIRKRRESGSLKQFLIAFAASYLDRLPGQLHARLAGARRPGADRAAGGGVHPGCADRAELPQHVGAADRVRGGARAAAEGPPHAAEGDRRLSGERRGPRLRR